MQDVCCKLSCNGHERFAGDLLVVIDPQSGGDSKGEAELDQRVGSAIGTSSVNGSMDETETSPVIAS